MLNAQMYRDFSVSVSTAWSLRWQTAGKSQPRSLKCGMNLAFSRTILANVMERDRIGRLRRSNSSLVPCSESFHADSLILSSVIVLIFGTPSCGSDQGGDLGSRQRTRDRARKHPRETSGSEER